METTLANQDNIKSALNEAQLQDNGEAALVGCAIDSHWLADIACNKMGIGLKNRSENLA
jgi:hypothetical protein